MAPHAAATDAPSSSAAAPAQLVDATVDVIEPNNEIKSDYKQRTASWLDAAYHSVTAMVGAGVLGLPGTMATLGWAGGIVALFFSLFVSWHTYRLLVLMHEKPDLDSKDGSGYTRFDRYQDLSIYLLGKRAGWWALVPFQMMVCVGIMITYTVVGGDDLHAGIEALAPAGSHIPGVWLFYIVFIAVQLVLSMLPDFSSLGVVSLLGALMSAGYCTIAVVLASTAKVPADVVYTPMIALSPIQKVFAMFNALSTIMFAYGGHNMALEIQATLPQPPTVKRMMRGVHIAFVMTGIAYFAVAISGFRALGEASGSNIILTLSNGPAWVRSLARFMVVIHVAAAYQVYAHPAFQSLELWVARRTGGSVAGLKVDYDGGHWATRLVLRTALNLLCLLVASMLPFFGDLMGFVGALAVTPTTFLLPSLLWLYWAKPKAGSVSWGINWLIVVITAIIGVMGAIGSVYSIVLNVRTYKIFSA